jgi:hypothetical protein
LPIGNGHLGWGHECCCRCFAIKHLLNHRSPLVPHKHWGFYIVTLFHHQMRRGQTPPEIEEPVDIPTRMQHGNAPPGRQPRRITRRTRTAGERPMLDSDGDSDFC